MSDPCRFNASCRLIWIAGLLLVVVLCGKRSGVAEDAPQKSALPAEKETPKLVPAAPSPFDLPQIFALQKLRHQQTALLISQKKYDVAETILVAAVQQIPHDAIAHYNLACVQARLGKIPESLASLESAVTCGFRDQKQIKEDDDLEAIRSDPKFATILELAGTPLTTPPTGWSFTLTPARQVGNVLTVDESCTTFDKKTGLLLVVTDLSQKQKDRMIVRDYGDAGKLLETWFQEGTAAGNYGDLYDNHDSDHSNMSYDKFPQLTRIEYSPEAKKRQLHHGLQNRLQFNSTTLGNSSTALVNGPFWRSQGRIALTQPPAIQVLAHQYYSNHLYFYPEHKDHDPGHDGEGGGYGDLFPANTPYVILSQGSSYTDKVFMDAVCATLAAFRPEVKHELARQGLLMPTVQMIFRRCNKGIETEADYLSGKAHPTVFEGKNLDPVRMVTMAHEITLETLPPVVRIAVVEENLGVLGRDYFDVAPRERLFDTPAAVARVVKSSARDRRIVLSAETSSDPTGKKLSYHFVVLRGDAEKISIRPLNDTGSVAEIVVPWHSRRPISPGDSMESNRVDIGVFVKNKSYYSAPAFLSLTTLDNEVRKYDENGRILSVDYTDKIAAKHYVDPAIDFPKDWGDEYHYGDDGSLVGWTRMRGESREEFHHDGRLITRRDAEGRPVELREVKYIVGQSADNRPRLQQVLVEAAATEAPDADADK
ncbi:MAG: hypothetical protein R3C01_13600 [Planctomycetaceae bacterium]